MIRFLLAVGCVGLGLALLPTALADPVFNGADLGVIVAGVWFLGCVWPRAELVEQIGSDHPDALGSLDVRERGS